MGNLSSRASHLRSELDKLLVGDIPSTGLLGLKERIADLLLRALRDEQHPLSTQLQMLEERVNLDRRGELCERAKQRRRVIPKRQLRPERHFFMPQPGNTKAEKRRYWRLQLLLQTAARSEEHAAPLADRLLLSKTTMLAAADDAARASVSMWTERHYKEQLREAVAALAYAEPPLPIRLEGRTVHTRDGQSFRLSPQEAAFLSILIDKLGSPVTREQFAELHIRNPARIKASMMRKLDKHDVKLPIFSAPQSYLLADTPG